MREINLGTSATVHLIEGVRLIQCPLNTGFTVVCFTQCTLCFQKVCFLLQIWLLCIICGTYVMKTNGVVTQCAADICVTWLAYLACLHSHTLLA